MSTKQAILDYKSKVASRYVPVDPGLISQKIMDADYYLASVKHDGHLGILEINGETAALYNRSGERLAVPKVISGAKINGAKHALIAGEIVCMADGKTTDSRHVVTAIADPGNHDVRFAAFDLLSVDKTAPSVDPHERYGQLRELLKGNDEVFCIEQQRFESRKDIVSFFQKTIPGNEGVVVRSSNGIIYKIKPTITLDLVILGFAEAAGEREGMLRELLLGCSIGGNTWQIITKCGNGFSDDDRRNLLKQFSTMAVPSEYTEISGAKTAFVMIRPELVAEISCLDIIAETMGGPIKKMTLKDETGAGYTIAGPHNTASCITPVFQRIRVDKKADPEDAGIGQITRYVAIDAIQDQVYERTESEIIQKTVYTKKAKEGTAVRKITALKTNKEGTGEYPGFVVVYTDYSPGRKTPLEQDLYICTDRSDALARMEAIKAENIKKGWEAAG